MVTDWSEEAKARRSASAKKAAETRKANQAKKLEQIQKLEMAFEPQPYKTNSRVARWAMSGVSVIAMMHGATHIRWGARTFLMSHAFDSGILNNRTNSYT